MATNPLISGMKRVREDRLSEEAENLVSLADPPQGGRLSPPPGMSPEQHDRWVAATGWSRWEDEGRQQIGWDSVLADVEAFRDLAARLPDSPSPRLVETFQETAKDLITRAKEQRQRTPDALEADKYDAILSYLGKAEGLEALPAAQVRAGDAAGPLGWSAQLEGGEGTEVAESAAPGEEAPEAPEAPEASEAPAPEAPAPERSMRQDRGAAAQRAFAKSEGHEIFKGKDGLYEYAYNPADESFTIISSPRSRGGQVVRAGSKAHTAIAAERGPQPKLEGGGTYTEAALAGAAKASEALAPEPEEPSRQDKRFARQEKREEKMAERSKEDRGLMAFLRKNKPQKDDSVADAE